MKNQKPLTVISFLIMVLVFVSAGISILFNDIYRDGEWANAQWLGQDLVTLFLALPLLAVSAHQSLGNLKKRWFMVLGGIFFYFVYTYAFFMFAANLTVLYLFHFPIFGLSVVGLFLVLHALFSDEFSFGLPPAAPRIVIIIYFLFISVMVAGLWLTDIISHLTIEGYTSDVPGGEPPMIIYSLDLAIVIPLMIAAAVGLMRKSGWAVKLTGVMLVKTSTLGFALMAMTLSMYLNRLSPEIFLAVLWCVLGLMGTAFTICFMMRVSVKRN